MAEQTEFSPQATDEVTTDVVEEVHPLLIEGADGIEPDDAICDRAYSVMQVLDPDQDGIKNIRPLYRTIKVNNRRGEHVMLKLLAQGRVQIVPSTSKRNKAGANLYVWQTAPVAE